MNEKQTSPAVTALAEPAVMRPTKKQQELLQFIEAFIAEHGYSPSYREIMTGLNYTSVATVALHVGNLIKRGHVRKRDRSARSLEVVHPGATAPAAPLRTNQIKPGDERWLIEKVEYFFADAEALPRPGQPELDNLQILLAALKVLGLDGAAQSFAARLQQLKVRGAAPV